MPCSPVIEPPQARTCVKQFVQSSLAPPFGAGLVEIHHDVGVDVAVAGVAEAGDSKAVFPLQPRGESEEVFQAAARDDDILVQLGEAGVAEGIGELAADLPDGFALVLAEADFDEAAASGARRAAGAD